MGNLIDFHFHLDYYKDYNDKYNYINKNKIYTLCVTNMPELYEQCVNIFKCTQYIKFALGFNPQLVGTERFNKQLFNKYLHTTKYIGEVGLDYSKEYLGSKFRQREIFEYICSAVSSQNKIISIHARNSEEDVLEILIKNKIKSAVFHWYSGKADLINEIVSHGYYFSVNHTMTKSKNGQKIIKKIPISNILVESDGPFVQINRVSVTPEQLILTYRNLNDMLSVNMVDEVYNNLKKLLINNG
ncbi:TatD family hydrolase [Clostridium botulinum]|uniref:TatD family hydrolase n=1 Tax=Clostridium botulinum TaxID=1491 RepID=UPI000774538E|nr:TatD family hydrolase [Clostridium botulinum]AUN04847.1 TatD family deoxyribonuclease [Clostridium botulinum]